MSQDSTPTWLVWVVPISVALGVLWAVIKSYFELVSRSELKELIAEQDKKFLAALEQQRKDFEQGQKNQRDEQVRLHGENVATARETFSRVSELEKGVARIEGRIDGALSGKYPAIK